MNPQEQIGKGFSQLNVSRRLRKFLKRGYHKAQRRSMKHQLDLTGRQRNRYQGWGSWV